jgi:hypothetical protein
MIHNFNKLLIHYRVKLDLKNSQITKKNKNLVIIFNLEII